MSSTSNKPVYDPVYQHSDIDFEDRLQQHEEKKPWFSVSKEYVNWGLLLSTVAFAVLSLVLELGNPHCSYSGGFDIGAYTDLDIAREAIKQEIRSFTGTLKVHQDGSIERIIEGTQYVGPASPEVDTAWDELLIAREMGLYESEAGELAEYTLKNSRGNYIISLHVSHSLHCVNMLRRHVDFEYYYGNGSSIPSFYRLHLDHCLDHLRQTVECSSDLTPVTWQWADGLGLPTSQTDRPHTCRSYKHIREWAMNKRVHSHISGVKKPNGRK
ncbi:hypothetical protein BGZ57DRAFT_1010239 [Hyaloscypha finlandica]|nr:hypothetical protein BGZ57DRAFT_1010239 [Hyaloscypha finlandica]